MKQRCIFVLVLLVLFGTCAFAQEAVLPYFPDTHGGNPLPMSGARPLPITGTLTSVPPDVTAYSTTIYTATATPQLIAMLADVTEMTLAATGTFELYLGSAAIVASTTALYNATIPTSDTQTVYVGQSATPTAITVFQVAR